MHWSSNTDPMCIGSKANWLGIPAISVSWLGKVDAKTGTIQEGWYFQNNRHDTFKRTAFPSRHRIRNSRAMPSSRSRSAKTGLRRGFGWSHDLDFRGCVAGLAGRSDWRRAGALIQLSPNLDAVETCLFTDAETTFVPWDWR